MYNMLYLIGRLIEDPKFNETNDKQEVLITLAVQRDYKTVDGIYETDFVPCILWNNIANRTNEYCRKGDLVAIRGKIRTNKEKSIEIIVDKISFLATKNLSDGDSNERVS